MCSFGALGDGYPTSEAWLVVRRLFDRDRRLGRPQLLLRGPRRPRGLRASSQFASAGHFPRPGDEQRDRGHERHRAIAQKDEHARERSRSESVALGARSGPNGRRRGRNTTARAVFSADRDAIGALRSAIGVGRAVLQGGREIGSLPCGQRIFYCSFFAPHAAAAPRIHSVRSRPAAARRSFPRNSRRRRDPPRLPPRQPPRPFPPRTPRRGTC